MEQIPSLHNPIFRLTSEVTNCSEERVGGKALGLTDYRHLNGNTKGGEMCLESKLNNEKLVGIIYRNWLPLMHWAVGGMSRVAMRRCIAPWSMYLHSIAWS
jgi:hypothetical protein